MRAHHKISVQGAYFLLIKEGKKKVEGRIHKNQYREMQVGNLVEFQNESDPQQTLLCRIDHKQVYPSFKQMLVEEGVDLCLPGVLSIDTGESIYHGFPCYAQDAREFGVVAFRISNLESQ